MHAKTVCDIESAHREGCLAWAAALEAATPIEHEVDRIDILNGLGVRLMGLVYRESNRPHPVWPRRCPTDEPAADCHRRIPGRGSDRARPTAASAKPICITQVGAQALWNTPRMKPDDVIRACADKGRVVAIEAARHTTLTERHRSRSIESVIEHVENSGTRWSRTSRHSTRAARETCGGVRWAKWSGLRT